MIKKILIFFIIFALTGCVKNKLADEKKQTSGYFAPTSIALNLLEPPIKRDSKEYQNEVYFITKLQKKADKNLIQRAELEAKVKPEMMFYFTDLKFERSDFPALYHLLDRVYKTSYGVTHLSKDYFATSRPYHSEKKIKALVKKIDSPAYPSGHTSSSYLAAKVLTLAMPQHSKIFHQRASEIASSRVLIGAHYPHDIEAGKKLALLMMGALTQNNEFLTDLENAKKELTAKMDVKVNK
jgi:acid phosphatase (class A)